MAIIGTRGYPSYYGGFETAVRHLAPYLAEAGWEVTVYGRPGAMNEDDPSRDSRVNTVKTWGISSKSVSTLSYGFTSSCHALLLNPDVALVMNVANGYFLPLLKARGIPTLVNVDGIEWARAKWGTAARRVFRLGAQLTSTFGDELVYDSHEIARQWKAMFGREGTFIPYGGDVPDALPLEPGLSHRGYVLVVARFVPENTTLEFVEAVDEIAEHLPVVIVGSSGFGGPLEQHVAALARDNDRVTWLGHISDDRRLLALWQHAAVYFHGHSVGGTNPSLVQAMATGAPIVARDTPYNREALGEHGRFCLPNRTSIARSIIALATDAQGQEVASRQNLARSRGAYTWGGVNAAYERCLANLACASQ